MNVKCSFAGIKITMQNDRKKTCFTTLQALDRNDDLNGLHNIDIDTKPHKSWHSSSSIRMRALANWNKPIWHLCKGYASLNASWTHFFVVASNRTIHIMQVIWAHYWNMKSHLNHSTQLNYECVNFHFVVKGARWGFQMLPIILLPFIQMKLITCKCLVNLFISMFAMCLLSIFKDAVT